MNICQTSSSFRDYLCKVILFPQRHLNAEAIYIPDFWHHKMHRFGQQIVGFSFDLIHIQWNSVVILSNINWYCMEWNNKWHEVFYPVGVWVGGVEWGGYGVPIAHRTPWHRDMHWLNGASLWLSCIYAKKSLPEPLLFFSIWPFGKSNYKIANIFIEENTLKMLPAKVNCVGWELMLPINRENHCKIHQSLSGFVWSTYININLQAVHEAMILWLADPGNGRSTIEVPYNRGNTLISNTHISHHTSHVCVCVSVVSPTPAHGNKKFMANNE